MSNYFIFASDKRAYLDTINVVTELSRRNLNYFYLYSEDINTQHPLQSMDKFSYDTNLDLLHTHTQGYHFKSINCTLPFVPDFVILTRESWQPQQHIISEFKQHGSVISCIENSNWIIGTIKSRLEMLSRFKFPTNCIDVFFESSNWSLETKKMCGWYNFKSEVVGNPKYDDVHEDSILTSGLDTSNGILVFGTMEKESKLKVYDILKKLKETNLKIYYRPHPGELLANPNLKFDNIEIVYDESDVPSVASKTDYHIGNIGASAYFSFLFDKTFIALDESNGRLDDLDINFFKGSEYDFWAPLINVDSWDKFVNKIGIDRIEKLKNRYEELKKDILFYDDEFKFLERKNSPISGKFFDDYNDKKTSTRIVDYLENLYD